MWAKAQRHVICATEIACKILKRDLSRYQAKPEGKFLFYRFLLKRDFDSVAERQ